MPKAKPSAAPARRTARVRVKVKAQSEPAPDLKDPSLFVNRELSLLAFQRRVLEEAEDENNPLLERVKFLSIVGSNLDEFYMVRVAGLLEQIDAGIVDVGPDGMTPQAQMTAIRREVKQIVFDAHTCIKTLVPALEQYGIRLLEYGQLSETQTATAKTYFDKTIFPVLTPLAFDPGRPFPHISNLSLNLAVVIRDSKGVEHFARVKVPDSLPQLVPVTVIGGARTKYRRAPKRIDLVWIESVVAANLGALFPGMEVVEAHPFHVTRDGDIAIRELESEDLLETVEQGLRQRRFGSVVRLQVGRDMPKHVLKILLSNFEIERTEVYRSDGPLGLKRLMSVYNLDRPELKDPPFVPAVPEVLATRAEDEDLFSIIRREDVLLHHPYDSFQPVIDFLRKAAQDDNVLAIKMVLYRVGRNSPIVDALLEATEWDKQVAVLVELKARFDEESNIEWARRLENEGVHVVYGLLGLKIHCKVAMVVRREGNTIRRYVHLGTGNYNAVTSHLYTDLGMFTCDEGIADDATDLFNYLTGYSDKNDYQKLLVAPVNLRQGLRALIEREIGHCKSGAEGRLVFKVNSLIDPSLIRTLYRASQAGVKIQLIVRGMCCLRPGVPGVSDNIEVTSIVGRFLEHSRIYRFRNGGAEETYLGSADIMQRNLDRRVEVLFPVRQANLCDRIQQQILATYLSDTVKARRMNSDGTYSRKHPKRTGPGINSQEKLLPGKTIAS
jgi:polyphosphate kinase